jgi:hypothetical protein
MQHSPLFAPQEPLPRPIRLLLTLGTLLMLLTSVGLRCRSLGNIPGLNGDEAWYGARAVDILHGGPLVTVTPTGNPPNPLFLGPLVLLHLVFRPSIVVLRAVSLGSSLAALAINWGLCRWIFDRRTAVLSTLALAVLPVDIAYSRFAWDASQSLGVTLLVLYFSLAAVRFPQRYGSMLAAAVAAEAAAFLVHPSNIFAAAAIVVAALAGFPWREVRRGGVGGLLRRRGTYATVLIAALLAVMAGYWLQTPAAGRVSRQLDNIHKRSDFRGLLRASATYPRLLTGETVYRDISGAHSWLCWPAPFDTNHWGIDVVLFWCLALALPAAALRPWHKSPHSGVDWVLAASAASTLASFLLLAVFWGRIQALAPGYERFALCLVAPAVLLAARGAARCADASPVRRLAVLAGASILGWIVLADFQQHYFAAIERDGGDAHPTFRTGPVEPKWAALQSILQQRRPGDVWIVTRQHWNEWPLRYLAAEEPDVHVVNPERGERLPDEAEQRAGRVWYVEFCGSEELAQAEAAVRDRPGSRLEFCDFARRPVLCVLHADR